FADLAEPNELRRCATLVALGTGEAGEVLTGDQGGRMLLAQCRAASLEDLAQQAFRLAQPPARPQDVGDVVEAGQGVGMGFAQHAAADLERGDEASLGLPQLSVI